MTRILVVEDDSAVQRTLRINLHARGYDVLLAADGRTALECIREDHPDLVLLDLGLPDVDGVKVLTTTRQMSTVPIIVLSARHLADDKVEALDLGADDYVTKPFGMNELLARIRTALRHCQNVAQTNLVATTAHFRLDFGEHQARNTNGEEIRLTPTEWRFLHALALHGGHLVTQTELLKQVWGPAYGKEANYLRVYANQLRRKLEPDPGHPRYLLTEPGIGYRFIADIDDLA